MPSHFNFFTDDNKLDTPSFIRSSSPLEMASAPMANMREVRRIHSQSPASHAAAFGKMEEIQEREGSSDDDEDGEDADFDSLEANVKEMRPKTPMSLVKTRPESIDFTTTMNQEINRITADLRSAQRDSPGLKLREKYVKDSFISGIDESPMERKPKVVDLEEEKEIPLDGPRFSTLNTMREAETNLRDFGNSLVKENLNYVELLAAECNRDTIR